MATNGRDSWDETDVRPEFGPHTPESLWARDSHDVLDAGYGFVEPASSPFHAAAFNDPYHVSPMASPETAAICSIMADRSHQPPDPMACQWPTAVGTSAAPFPDYQTAFSTGPDWQTPTPFGPHSLPDYEYTQTAMLPYMGAWKDGMPMESVEYGTATHVMPHTAMGSFSSTDSSSSFDASLNQTFSVPDTWETHGLPGMAHQYSLRPSLQLPASSSYASERDTSLEGTISPKLTRIRPSPSFQSAASSPADLLARRNSDSGASDSPSKNNQPVTTAGSKPSKAHARQQRTRLPSPKVPSSRRLLPAAPKAPKTSRPSPDGKAAPASKPDTTRQPPNQHSPPAQATTATATAATATAASEADSSSRAAKDEFLLKAKAKGLTYKEIRRRGNFAEAESTLRGRYRTLTKPKDLRVRKPEWSDNDLRLLERAVRRTATVARGQNLTAAKVPWREVAESIYQDGGSYLFGLSTCRKRWDELVAAETGRGKDPARPFYEQ